LRGLPDRIDITVIGGEPQHPSYNHILLSSELAGERTLAEIPFATFCLSSGIQPHVQGPTSRQLRPDAETRLSVDLTIDTSAAVIYARIGRRKWSIS